MTLSAAFTQALLTRLAHSSPGARARLGRWLGAAAWLLVRRRRRVAMRNLELCFPDLSENQRRQLGREHFHALAQSVIDRSVLWFGPPDTIRDLVHLEGVEHMHEALRRGPVILLAPHFVGLDAGATRLSMESPAASMYQVQSNPDFDAMFRAGRSRFNDIKLVSRREGIRGLLRYLQAGLPVYYLPDMDFGERGSVFVPFFGVPAATLTAPAHIARNYQAQVLPVLTAWNADTGRYTTRVLPALEHFPGEDTLEAASARLNHHIEDWVREVPAQYHWVHKRFKTRPEGEADLY